MASSWALQLRFDDFMVSSLSFSVKDFRLERWSSLDAAMHSGFFKVLSVIGSIEESQKDLFNGKLGALSRGNRLLQSEGFQPNI